MMVRRKTRYSTIPLFHSPVLYVFLFGKVFKACLTRRVRSDSVNVSWFLDTLSRVVEGFGPSKPQQPLPNTERWC